MSEDERSAIVDLLAASPEVGDLIPGTGGLRKVRVPLAGRGKRGGARVIYYVYDQRLPIYLLLGTPRMSVTISPPSRSLLCGVVENILAGRQS